MLFFVFTIGAKAQSYIEIVYLKNGSVIKGVVIEQIPSQSLKIKTSDGSLFVYSMSEVDRIVKEQITDENIDRRTNRSVGMCGFGKKTSKVKVKGYRGFVDVGYIESLNDKSSSFEITTTHGYLFNPYIFLGGGVGVDFSIDDDVVAVPIYGDFKVNFCKANNSPFFDFKLGFSVGDRPGYYVAPALGIRFGLLDKKAINISVGYRYQEQVELDSNFYNFYSKNETPIIGLSIKVGLEF